MEQVLGFLRDIAANNDREWFMDNKLRYKEAEATVGALAEELIGAIGEFDPDVRGLSVRECTYRIYRDTRFSHDKTPYKTHFGIYVCPGGKKSGNAGYYLHIEATTAAADLATVGTPTADLATQKGMIGSHILDAGVYMPAPEVLRSVRDEVFDNGAAVVAALGVAAAAGFELDRSNSLKRTPVGFPAGGEWDEYLRLKDFHVSKAVGDEYILAPGLARRAAEDFGACRDFMRLVQRAARFGIEEGR
ncbi:MAG: DUF2461 domain-containing protein [Alistipes sp.]|jgi:uncharacterized protein (DUF2461 family)|nr:DUF2461 domain-containing protein [Alistipes sp.]